MKQLDLELLVLVEIEHFICLMICFHVILLLIHSYNLNTFLTSEQNELAHNYDYQNQQIIPPTVLYLQIVFIT